MRLPLAISTVNVTCRLSAGRLLSTARNEATSMPFRRVSLRWMSIMWIIRRRSSGPWKTGSTNWVFMWSTRRPRPVACAWWPVAVRSSEALVRIRLGWRMRFMWSMMPVRGTWPASRSSFRNPISITIIRPSFRIVPPLSCRIRIGRGKRLPTRPQQLRMPPTDRLQEPAADRLEQPVMDRLLRKTDRLLQPVTDRLLRKTAADRQERLPDKPSKRLTG